MAVSDRVAGCLADLEMRIDPAVEEALLEEWAGFCEGRFEGGIFSPVRSRAIRVFDNLR